MEKLKKNPKSSHQEYSVLINVNSPTLKWKILRNRTHNFSSTNHDIRLMLFFYLLTGISSLNKQLFVELCIKLDNVPEFRDAAA